MAVGPGNWSLEKWQPGKKTRLMYISVWDYPNSDFRVKIDRYLLGQIHIPSPYYLYRNKVHLLQYER
jgi:hypothetical protein